MTEDVFSLNNMIKSMKVSFIKSNESKTIGVDTDTDTSIINNSVCSICNSNDIVQDETLLTCMKCSCIIGSVIDQTQEWRSYTDEKSSKGSSSDPSRCGMPTNFLLPKSSLGSVAKGCSRDMMIVKRLETWNMMPYNERKLLCVFEKFMTSTNNNGIPMKVIQDAKYMYKQASNKKISRGDNSSGLIASCIYHSCIINNVPRSMKEISEMFNIDSTVLTKGNARFQKLMPMNVRSSSAKDFVSRFGSQLDLSMKDISLCKDFVEFLEEEEIITDNSPTTSAAGSIAYFCLYHGMKYVLKKDISNVCSVSEVTINNSIKTINKYKDTIDEFFHKK